MKNIFFYSFIIIFISISCKTNKKYEVLDYHTRWNIVELIFEDKQIVENDDLYNNVSGNYIYFSFAHKKVGIELSGIKKQKLGDFKIKYGKLKDSIIFENFKDSIINGAYEISLDTINKGAFSTKYMLLLKSKKVFLLAKKTIA